MPTKTELTIEQSQQGVSDDVLVQTPMLQPHSSKVGFITTCSYSIFKSNSFSLNATRILSVRRLKFMSNSATLIIMNFLIIKGLQSQIKNLLLRRLLTKEGKAQESNQIFSIGEDKANSRYSPTRMSSVGQEVYPVRWSFVVDTPYRAMWDTAYWECLGVRTMFDIFQNILLLYCEYGVLMSPGYGVLGLQSFVVIREVQARIRRIFLMDTAY
ncbi:hypothetical protein Tco_1067194 [Tanacetum coccineum]|uniref:Uncharacterized protein n=1 Tax=Tanacetum coccineum TaxID=301880 RepID=A0ABQ5HE32_9ASTR